MPLTVIAHRGESRYAPENTLPAFRRAIDLGVDYVELDYHEASDGTLVVIHDRVLDRTTDAAIRPRFGPGCLVRTRSYEDLRELDAAAWPDGRWAGFGPAAVPRLADALNLIAGEGGAGCMIERKPAGADPDRLCAVIRDPGVQPRVVISAASSESDAVDFLHACEARLPGVRLAYQLSADFFPDPDAFRKGHIVSCDQGLVTRPLVRMLSGRGLAVWAWTVNDVAEARRLAECGVEGLITDVPREMMALVRSPGFP